MKKELNLLSRDFYPDNAAVARIATDLAKQFAKHYIVNVYAGKPFYYSSARAENLKNKNIRITRVWCPDFSKDNLLLRAITEAAFAANTLFKLLASKKKLNIVMSLPFSLQAVALLMKKIKRQKYILVNHEVMPELMAATNVLSRKNIFYKILHYVSKKIIDNSEYTVSIGRAMTKLLKSKTKYPEKIKYIPSWADSIVKPVPRNKNSFLRQNHLTDKFIVSYSGNLGRYIDVETVLSAAKELESKKDIVFLFIGGGKKKELVLNYIKQNNSRNVMFFDYLPVSQINDSLNSGDISLVLMGKRTRGVVVPSKIYQCIAAGKPAIAVTEPGTEIERIIENLNSGLIVRPGDVNSFKNAVLKLRNNKQLLNKMAKNSLQPAKSFSVEKVAEHYLELVKESV
jgi:glycosyltransferase involved in cell wall biosynthesis